MSRAAEHTGPPAPAEAYAGEPAPTGQEATESTDRATASQRGDVMVAAVIAVAAVVARIVILRATHSTTEDYYITLRYAENIAHGLGFVYNAGESVLGTTTPLYTLFLALAASLHLDATVAGKAANILADGATCYLIARLMARLGHPVEGWLAALLYATATAPIDFSIGGMETGLVTLAGVVAVYAYVVRRGVLLGAALGLLFLLRVDGLVLAVALIAGWAVERRRVPWRAVAALAVLALPWIVFATLYFGSPVPTSLAAKLTVYGAVRGGRLPNLPQFRTQFLSGVPQLATLALFLVGAVSAWRRQAALRAPILWMLIYYGAVLVSKVIAFGWYFVPPLPVYFVVAALGAGVVWRRAERVAGLRGAPNASTATTGGHGSRGLATAGILLLAAVLGLHLRQVKVAIARAQRTEDVVRLPIGLWLHANARPSDTVLLEPIGYVGYFSGIRVLDAIGLVSPQVLPIYTTRAPHPWGELVARFRPTYLCLRPTEREDLVAYEHATGRLLLERDYRFVRAFDNEYGGAVFLIYRKVG